MHQGATKYLVLCNKHFITHQGFTMYLVLYNKLFILSKGATGCLVVYKEHFVAWRCEYINSGSHFKELTTISAPLKIPGSFHVDSCL
jgi:hypothetical protein